MGQRSGWSPGLVGRIRGQYNWSMTSNLEAWITGYRQAWESNEPDEIRALFTKDAEYRTDPWAVPWRGHEEIVANWLDRKDEPGSAAFEWSELVSTPDVSIIQGTTVYRDGPTYSNLWVIKLTAEGRARSFTEWWMDQSNPA